jgi:uncharacterized protein
MKKLKAILLIIFGAVILGGCSHSQPLSGATPKFSDHQLVEVKLGNISNFELEIVNTPQSISQGLSGRDEIGSGGMLFIFNQELAPKFWMKDMKFDLDLIWIKDNQVVEITKNVPSPTLETSLNELPTYSPSQPVSMVLEVKSGLVDELQIKIGHMIHFN